METAQEMEWSKAQEIAFSVDLVEAAKKQLRFLAAVESDGSLYEGPAHDRAIYRYNNCWLPLLAKHLGSSVPEGILIVPLDCEWIWHCHRLNPLQYLHDCKEIYGRLLGKLNVSSTVETGACTKQTESIWNRMFVTEPYHLELNDNESPMNSDGNVKAERTTEYDLVAAVKRQSTFFKKVSRVVVNDDGFLKESVARYKGFLHLIKRTKERSIQAFCVPTLDIDLIWHAHQLNPVAYCKDMRAIYGRVMDHNDRDSAIPGGKEKVDLGFKRTEELWEETFGRMYSMKGIVRGVSRCKMDHVPGLGVKKAGAMTEGTFPCAECDEPAVCQGPCKCALRCGKDVECDEPAVCQGPCKCALRCGKDVECDEPAVCQGPCKCALRCGKDVECDEPAVCQGPCKCALRCGKDVGCDEEAASAVCAMGD